MDCPRTCARRWLPTAATPREITELLAADNLAPVVNLVALPGVGSLDEAVDRELNTGRWLPILPITRAGISLEAGSGARRQYPSSGCRLSVGRPRAGQESHCRMAGEDTYWLDLCAGPGGKAASAGGPCHYSWSRLPPTNQLNTAPNSSPRHWSHGSGHLDDLGARWPRIRGSRILRRLMTDHGRCPCSGLGALRRRPSHDGARARRTLRTDVLQGELLDARAERRSRWWGRRLRDLFAAPGRNCCRDG